MTELEIGVVDDFFAHPVVASIILKAGIKKGDTIHIRGHATDITFTVPSIQINHVDVTEAKPGDSVGIKVPERVRRGDIAYKAS